MAKRLKVAESKPYKAGPLGPKGGKGDLGIKVKIASHHKP
jgi:hypothetical protein